MTYLVVVNHEEQHSLWPESRELPAGWLPTGFSGTREECLDHIATVWTDIRPASVRRGHTAPSV
ncbi:MbtH family protein [Actinomadura sp. 6K520]|uniref:MbtH family protein n=1 Tax=Actinomadura sp. 6K520 TaxID=2530364 RepID=UPI0010499F1B|nr:MbtH family protein [Actinomadura sp. 6K520]TDE32822.1 MbtH family protein [Actinomadura sp. 6K520]